MSSAAIARTGRMAKLRKAWWPQVSAVLLAAIIVTGAAIRIYYFDPDQPRTPDEYTYTSQALVVMAQGRAGYRLLGEQLAGNPPAVSRYSSPMRAGYLTLLTGFMRITGDPTIVAGAQL